MARSVGWKKMSNIGCEVPILSQLWITFGSLVSDRPSNDKKTLFFLKIYLVLSLGECKTAFTILQR